MCIIVHGFWMTNWDKPVPAPTPGGKLLFQMLGVFAEFERSMIVERVKAGLKRAKADGKTRADLA